MLILETSRKIKARQSLYGKRKSVKQFVIMTPENPMMVKSTPERNAAARKRFEGILQSSGLYAQPVQCHYGNKENSYIVFNMPFDLAKELATTFDQESFIFAKVAGENSVQYEFWQKEKSENDEMATPQQKQYWRAATGDGVIRDNGLDKNYTLVGKGFKFTVPFNFFECVSFYDDLIDERCQRSKLYEAEWEALRDRSIDDNIVGRGRIMARSRLYGNAYLFYYENPEGKTINELLKLGGK